MAQYLNLKPVEFDALSKKAKASFEWKGRRLLPKYDGCFMMVAFWDGKPDFILSRAGEVVKSCDHIYDDVLERYPKIAQTKGGKVFLGEAWRPGTEFAVLSGEFRRQRPQLGLGFAVFDLVNYTVGADDMPVLHSPHTYADRLALLEDCDRLVGGNCFPPLSVVCEGEAHAWRYALKLKAMGGYDGAVAGNPYADYPGAGSGKCGSFIKLKPLKSFSLEVVAVVNKLGEKTGRAVGTPVVRFKKGTCGVGTGFSNDDAEAWYKQPNLIVGKIIEVGCMDVYPGETGMMREPRFLGVRDDVTKPDY